MSQNPFQYGRELAGDELADRETEIAEVVSAIQEGGKLFLIGPRRYGKTSILQVAQHQSEQAGAVVFRYDAEAWPTLDLLTRAILVEATERLSGSLSKAGEKMRKFFSRLKPEISFSLSDQTVSGSLGVSAEEANDPNGKVLMLVDLLNGLEKLAAEAGRPVGLMLDEFQKVIALGGADAEGQIRAAVQRHKHVGYIFAGSKTRMLTDMTGQPSRPFYRLGERRFIGAIPRADFTRFLADRFKGARIKATEAGLTAILDLAEDVPYNVQRLAHACWDSLQHSGGRTGRKTGGKAGGKTRGKLLDENVVRQELELLVRRDDTFYSQLWNQLTAVQQKALIALLREGAVRLLSQQVTRAYGLSPSSMQRALKSLQDRDLLRSEEGMGAVRLRLEDPFFGTWIKLVTSRA